jgi:G:T/U-mismatch repair DNA glycosylase
MKPKISTETHPDWYYEVPGMKLLILGSYPPHESRRYYNFYYPNKINRFWDILAGIHGSTILHREGTKAVTERKRLMRELKAGVHNMGRKIRRKGSSSADNDIEIVEFQDILAIIKKQKQLKRILLTGYSGPSSTFHAFIRYLAEQRIAVDAPKKPVHGSTFALKVFGREIECVVVYSTSPRFPAKLNTLIEKFAPYIIDL